MGEVRGGGEEEEVTRTGRTSAARTTLIVIIYYSLFLLDFFQENIVKKKITAISYALRSMSYFSRNRSSLGKLWQQLEPLDHYHGFIGCCDIDADVSLIHWLLFPVLFCYIYIYVCLALET